MYLGNIPATSFETVQKDRFTGVTGTTVTLSHAVSSVNDILVFVNAVKQDYTNYSVNLTTLTLGGTLVASDIVEVCYVARTFQTVNPSAGSVGTSQLATNSISTIKIQDDAVTKDKLLSHNYPAFLSNGVSSTQTLSDGATTKVAMANEVFDTDNCYDTSTYRFTPNVAGKYFCHGFLRFGRTNSNATGGAQIMIYKNGVNSAQIELYANGTFNLMGSHISTIFEMNGTTDYLELFIFVDVSSGNPKVDTGGNKNHFGAFRIGD